MYLGSGAVVAIPAAALAALLPCRGLSDAFHAPRRASARVTPPSRDERCGRGPRVPAKDRTRRVGLRGPRPGSARLIVSRSALCAGFAPPRSGSDAARSGKCPTRRSTVACTDTGYIIKILRGFDLNEAKSNKASGWPRARPDAAMLVLLCRERCRRRAGACNAPRAAANTLPGSRARDCRERL